MYSIKGTKDIEFNYNISNIRKISDTEYQYHGKPNSPNLVLSNGIKRISYVAERIEMKQKELIIHHSATSNFPKRAMVIFPLVVSNGRVTVIDRLLEMEMNETLDLDIGSEITDFTMEINETQKSVYIIRLSGGLPISEKQVIVEGNCGMNDLQIKQLGTAFTHAETQGGLQNHTMDDDDFNKKLNNWLDTGSKCYKDGKHYMKDNSEDDVSMDESGTIRGVKEIKKEGDSDGLSELSPAQCSTIGGTKVIGGSSLGGGGSGSGSGISPNQEMECFPNEGGVFNKKFHIIYDKRENGQFIAEDGVRIHEKDETGIKSKPLRDAMNAEVKRLKQHIEKLGGIYVPIATIPDAFKKTEKGYKFINRGNDINISATAIAFFKDTNNKEIDIFITYVASDTSPKLRMFTGINSNNELEGEGPLTKPHQVKECILVAVKNGDTSLLMNAKKFSEDYLNKDFNRYTHISIPGYMTETENQSMKAIVYLLAMILTTIVSYYTVPGFYKIAIKKITRNQRTCSLDGENNYTNYYNVTAFNYFFTIITVIVPIIIMIFTSTLNGILLLTSGIGIICVFTMIVRFTNDKEFFYDFYPRNGLITCNKTKDFQEKYRYSSKFRVFTYIPSAVSALFSG